MPVAAADAPTAPIQRLRPTPAPVESDAPSASRDVTPDVSDLLAQMPAWAARGLLYIAGALAVTALVWARFSVVDIVVQARGAVVPEGHVRHVQAETDGVIEQVRVREGATVRRGQTLFELDGRDLRLRASHMKAELANSEEQLRQELVMHGPTSESLERQNRIAQLRNELTAIDRAIFKGAVTAPVDGTITALDVVHAGAVIRVGQQLASIAPSRAPLIVEVQVPNARIGRIKRGSAVKIKLDAFPFQDYGSLTGTVIDIAADAKTSELRESFYRVLVMPDSRRGERRGRALQLRPGLSVTAEILTERRTVLDLILAPVRKLRAEMAEIE
jgi:multidrug efflux pump subunit AcrA (membrane-fusion protein)